MYTGSGPPVVETMQDRVKALTSEVARLKSRLAAQANDEDLMTFFFKYSNEERSYVEDLKERLASVVLHYHSTIRALANSHSIARSEQPKIVSKPSTPQTRRWI